MKILAIADVHGDLEMLPILLDKVKENYDFDVIVFPGDWTDVNPPKGFEQIDVAMLLLEELKKNCKQLIAVPGNVDSKDLIPLLEEEGVSVHGRGIVVDNVGFYGYGGARTPFKTNIEPSEEELKLGLEKSWYEIKDAKFKVQVTHMPPLHTKIDLITTGLHVGSQAIRDFIESNQPTLAISAHVHEGFGMDKIGKTLLFNPGRFPEGKGFYVEIKEDGTVSFEEIRITV